MSIGSAFKGLFGQKEPTQSAASTPPAVALDLKDVYDPNLDTDRIGLALLVMLEKQASLLDVKLGDVPAEGRFASPKCRGALLGTAFGITMIETTESSPRQLKDTVLAAFVFVYGESAGCRLANQTLYESSVAGFDELTSASDWAVKDVAGVYASNGSTSAVGFYAACTGMI